MNRFGRFILPLVIGGLAISYIAVAMTPSEETVNGMNLREFGQLPIVDRGRVKPIDAMARTDLTLISGKQTYYDDEKKEHTAVEWLLDVLTSRPPFANQAAANNKVFRIENLQVLSLLDLKPKPGSYRYSLNEMGKKWNELDAALHRRRRQEGTGQVRSKAHGVGRTSEVAHRVGRLGFAASARSGRSEGQADFAARHGRGVVAARRRRRTRGLTLQPWPLPCRRF